MKLKFSTQVSRRVNYRKIFKTAFQVFFNTLLMCFFFFSGINGCTGDSGCPELCFGIPEAPFSACECRDGWKITSDGKSCEKISNYKHPLACNASEFQCANFPKCIPFRYCERFIAVNNFKILLMFHIASCAITKTNVVMARMVSLPACDASLSFHNLISDFFI